MEDLFRQNMLFDFYSEVLTQRQQEICRMHLQEDWSLGEIAEEMNISRQAVSDALKHSFQAMEKAESKLHTVERFLLIQKQINVLEELLDQDAGKAQIKNQLQTLREAALLEKPGDTNGI